MIPTDDFYLLRWSDVNPDNYSFDPEPILSIIKKVTNNVPPGVRNWEWGQSIEDHIDQAIVNQYGPWAAGWRFSTGEGSGRGGVVNAYCCPGHSILKIHPGNIAKKAAKGLSEWYDHLLQLKDLFKKLTPRIEDENVIALDLYSGCTHILTFVAKATGAEDCWASYVDKVLSWYMESLGVDVKTADEVAEKITEGKFKSWVVPEEETINQIASDFKKIVVPIILDKANRL
jgi:hypothetical protein